MCSSRIVTSYEIFSQFLPFGNLCRDCVRCMFAYPTKLVCVGLVSGLSYSPSVEKYVLFSGQE